MDDRSDIFEPEPRDATGELRELAMEVLEQDDPTDTAKNLLISGMALLVLAVVVGFVGMVLVRWGLTVTNADIVGHDRLHPQEDNKHIPPLLYAGLGVSFVAAVIGIFALVSFAKIVMKRMRD